jgi:hypothetical protein
MKKEKWEKLIKKYNYLHSFVSADMARIMFGEEPKSCKIPCKKHVWEEYDDIGDLEIGEYCKKCGLLNKKTKIAKLI